MKIPQNNFIQFHTNALATPVWSLMLLFSASGVSSCAFSSRVCLARRHLVMPELGLIIWTIYMLRYKQPGIEPSTIRKVIKSLNFSGLFQVRYTSFYGLWRLCKWKYSILSSDRCQLASACMSSVWMFAVQSANCQELWKRLRESSHDVHVVVNRSIMWKRLGFEMSFVLPKTNTAFLQYDELKGKTICNAPCCVCGFVSHLHCCCDWGFQHWVCAPSPPTLWSSYTAATECLTDSPLQVVTPVGG